MTSPNSASNCGQTDEQLRRRIGPGWGSLAIVCFSVLLFGFVSEDGSSGEKEDRVPRGGADISRSVSVAEPEGGTEARPESALAGRAPEHGLPGNMSSQEPDGKRKKGRKRDGTPKEGRIKAKYWRTPPAERFKNTDQRERYDDWIDRVYPLISDAELEYFLDLEHDYRREAFMIEFWNVRDPNPGTNLNELKVRWRTRSEEALSLYGTLQDARAVFFLFNGSPGRFVLRDGRVLSVCYDKSNQLEIWFYGGSDQSRAQFAVVFLRRNNSVPYEIWYSGFSDRAWPRRRLPTTNPRLLCAEEFLPLAKQLIGQNTLYPEAIRRWTTGPEPPEEWLATFEASTSDLPDDAETFPAEIQWAFPGRNQNRTTTQGVMTVPLNELTSRVFAGRELVHLVVTGEILRNDRVFEQFRYRFELPVPRGAATRERLGGGAAAADAAAGVGGDVSEESAREEPGDVPRDGSRDVSMGEALGEDTAAALLGEDEQEAREQEGSAPPEEGSAPPMDELPLDESVKLPLVVTRYLRPGPAKILLKVEDVYGDRYARVESEVEVPKAADVEDSSRTLIEAFPFLAEALEAAEKGERYLKIIPPNDPSGVQYGVVRFDTQAVGEYDEVKFFLDDQEVLAKRKPPFAVSLNLGTVPGLHRVKVGGYVDGKQVAVDELSINQGGQRFKIRLTEPSADIQYTNSARAVAQVQIPEASQLDRVELYLDEERVATLYQEPFVSSFELHTLGLSIVRAVAFLTDGSQTEDVAFVNGPEFAEEIDVQYVQVYAGIVNNEGRAILDLDSETIEVQEDGVPQTLTRFEFVQDLPVHAGLLIDTSTSMEGSIEQVRAAAERFVESFVREQDRVTVMSFDTRAQIRIGFTNEKEDLVHALAGLEASGSTALYDAAIFALSYFDGITSQRALLLLSDGKDETSLFDFERTAEVARRSGVAIFAIGLDKASRDKVARRNLRTLAEETGGRAFFIDSVDELDGIYQEIDQDLRSRYLLVYQSTSEKADDEFRVVKVKVKQRGAKVRAMAGYYP